MNAREPCRPGDGISVSAGHLGVGSVIGGKYSLTRLLGEGAMGTVFEAHHHALDVDVAIKILRTRPRFGHDRSPRERMQREARAVASLGHPAIIRVFDAGVMPDGLPYLVMELLEGEDLASMLDRLGRLGPVTAVQSMLPIVEALAAAHTRQIIHRDLKPENVFLARTAGGATQPKLIDFGVAKLDDPAGRRLTLPGMMVGSPAYMSPEQVRGEEADARADIWAVCVILYELVTGSRPFDGPNEVAVLVATLEEPAVPISVWGVDEPVLWGILARGLSKDAADRWPSARALGAALARWLLAAGKTEDVSGTSLTRSWPDVCARAELDDGLLLPRTAPSSLPPLVLAAPAAPRPRGRGTAILAASGLIALLGLGGGSLPSHAARPSRLTAALVAELRSEIVAAPTAPETGICRRAPAVMGPATGADGAADAVSASDVFLRAALGAAFAPACADRAAGSSLSAGTAAAPVRLGSRRPPRSAWAELKRPRFAGGR